MLELCVAMQISLARMTRRLAAIWKDEKGATVAEYALVLVLVAVVLIAALQKLGTALTANIQHVIDKLPVSAP